KGDESIDVPSFMRSTDFEHVGCEVRGVRRSVGVTEIANFAKYQVTGEGAEAWLSYMMTNTMPKTGRIVLTPMLNEKGKLIGDFTIAKAAENRFQIWGSSAAQVYHMRWFEAHLPDDGSVNIHLFGMNLVGLSIAGPNARKLLQELVDRDISNEAFRFMDYAEMDVARAPCRVNRISYTGDLGYEIWMEPAYERQVYLAIKDAGAKHDIIDFGMRALLSMRLEKNFPTWFAELRPIYGPFEADMDRFVKLRKNDFIGREAAAKEHADGPRLKRVTFVVETQNGDVIGDEPIWARVGDTDYGTIPQPHSFGGRRFDAAGCLMPKPEATVDGAWRVVGWVTSGGYGHFVKASLAQGYVPSALSENTETGMFAIELRGQRCPARLITEPLFDAPGVKMRS
ncbi:MAG: aminomethyltransferase family protein, partial [Paracoccaceae bacterium]